MLVCKICGFEAKNNLVSHIKYKHNVAPSEYKKIYNSPVLVNSDQTRKKISDSVKLLGGNVNSKKYWILQGYSDEEASVFSKQHARKGSKRCVEYWTSRGYTVDDAKMQIAELQSTYGKRQPASKHKWISLGYTEDEAVELAKTHLSKKSLLHVNYWIERHDMTEEQARAKITEIQRTRSMKSSKYAGKISTPKRNNKISISMKKKIEEVGKVDWASHFGKFTGRSLLEEEIFEYVQSISPHAEHNIWIDTYNVDIAVGNKVIEVFGDYWHANPQIISLQNKNKEYVEKMSTIREQDERRLEYIRNKSFSVLVVWENDWRNNLQETKQVIREFLK